MHETPTATRDDWKMYGGDIGRTNNAHEVLLPPLSVVWENTVSGGFGPYSASTVDDLLCVGDLRGEVRLLDINTGSSFGVRNFGSAVIGTPIIDGNYLYVALAGNENSLLSYNLRNGSVDWRLELGEIETAPLITGNHLYVTTLSGKVVSVEKLKGDIVWIFDPPIAHLNKRSHSSPASDGKVLVYGTDGGYLNAVGVNDGKMLWQTKVNGSILSSPTIIDGKVFIGSLDSTFYSFDLSTGKQIWKQSLNASIYTSQAVNTEYVYASTVNKTLYCLRTGDGSIVWKVNIGSIAQSAPLISGNTVYVGCLDKRLFAFNAGTENVIWEFQTEGRIKSIPVIAQGHLFIFSEDRIVLALQPSGN
ncbi:MAG: PQQ-like beta-propeller repeat protein [Ignavibacteriales bacterium]|nr:PQQ-like beta-propeller repeat protein [Ignavibacteriales bacterium]